MTKILLIEDSPDLRENTSEILTLANYDVVTAENGKIGVEMVLKEQPDLIICDIMMPELDGYGVLHILSRKPETAAIPFIFLTAKAEKTDVRRGMELGADDYLTKPFSDTSLLNAIETRLRKYSFRSRVYEPNASGLDAFMKDAKQILNLKDLGKDNKVKQFKKKASIFSEGDTPSTVFFIKSGHVKTFKAHQDGKELITNLYNEGDFFAFEPVLENTEYGESAVALQDSEIILIPKADFLSLLNSHPDVSASFITLLCKKVAEKEKQLVNLAYSSIRQRTAEALLKTLPMKDGQDMITLSREDLARIVGTASESVIRVLSEFKEEKLVEVDGGRIKILQPAKLEKVVKWNVAR